MNIFSRKRAMGGLDKPISAITGPFIRFDNYDPESHTYKASVMVVLHPTIQQEPVLVYDSTPGGSELAGKILLDTFEGYNFWRFNLELPLLEYARTIKYTITAGPETVSKSFTVPGITKTWYWTFYSCNGFHEPAEGEVLDGIQPLWKDMMQEHEKRPFHLQVGGGDQIYNDPVWKIDTLLEWLAIDKEERVKRDPTPEMTAETNLYYFTAYCRHFSEPFFADALAQIPFVFTWDDHDIFDGYGSYPDALQNCTVFNMVFAAAKRFYLLFQQHANEQNVVALNNTFGAAGGYNEIKYLGSSVALWDMDNRTERSINTIVHNDTHEMAKQKLLALPKEVRHVIVLATVPLVYPELPAEGIFQQMQDNTGFFGTLFNKTGLSQNLLNQFGEPDLLDDIIDHWSASTHQEERTLLIKNMQEVAIMKKVRVTFISGDVHSAGIGRFYSYPKTAKTVTMGSEVIEDFREDFRYMANITSSAIGNTPMPANLVAAYNKTNSAADVKDLKPTREKMVRRFRGQQEKVLGCRNYCVVEEYPYNPESGDVENGCLNFTLRGENRKKGGVDIWHNFVPVLTSNVDAWAGSRAYDLPIPEDELQD